MRQMTDSAELRGRPGGPSELKIELMCAGVRYSEALGAAAAHAVPNFYPYRFQPGERNPTGKDTAAIPYMMETADGTMMRVLASGRSPWHVEGSRRAGYLLIDDTTARSVPIEFLSAFTWMSGKTSDGFPLAQSGVSNHGDMLVINVAPGCEYFLHKQDGVSMRCIFCSYGAPDERTAHLGQVTGQVEIPERTLARMLEGVDAITAETEIRHIYLVGGSLTDAHLEGERFLQLARAVRTHVGNRFPIALGSGALPDEAIRAFARERLVDSVCFNLEIWSQPLFAKVCPGKQRYVGYERWIEALETAVALWGRGRVYSAMVAGIELEPEFGLSWEEAARIELQGAEDLCSRGVIPIYSLHWPTGGRLRPDYHDRLGQFFRTVSNGYAAIRRRHGLEFWPGFMCHRCAYMQVECDIDRWLPRENAA
jgi:hypothetical protein